MTKNNFLTKVWAAPMIVGVALVGFVSTASADVNASVLAAATSGGTDMYDTVLAICAAMIPLGIGIWIARKAWRVIKGFF